MPRTRTDLPVLHFKLDVHLQVMFYSVGFAQILCFCNASCGSAEYMVVVMMVVLMMVMMMMINRNQQKCTEAIHWTNCLSRTTVQCAGNTEVSKCCWQHLPKKLKVKFDQFIKLKADKLKYSQRIGGCKGHILTTLSLENNASPCFYTQQYEFDPHTPVYTLNSTARSNIHTAVSVRPTYASVYIKQYRTFQHTHSSVSSTHIRQCIH